MRYWIISTFILIFSSQFVIAQKLSWANALQGDNRSYGSSIVSDDLENIIITGHFRDSVDFDPGTGVQAHNTGALDHVFLAKYDAIGNYVWSGHLEIYGTNGYGNGYQVTVDKNNNIFLVGYFTNQIDLDIGPNVSLLTASGNSRNSFIAKYDKNGVLIWGRKIGPPVNVTVGGSVCRAIALDSVGNVYVTGDYSLTIEPNTGSTASILSSSGGNEIYLAKFDNDGNFFWAISLGGAGSEISYDIGIDKNENVVLLGLFSGTANFNFYGSTNLTSGGNSDLFIAGYSPAGNYRWAKAINNNNIGVGGSTSKMSLDELSNIYISGSYAGTADFDPSFSTSTLTANGVFDGFLAKYSVNGDYIWAKSIAGNGRTSVASVCVEDSNGVYIAGRFSNEIELDPLSDIHKYSSSADLGDGFLAYYDANGNIEWSRHYGKQSSYFYYYYYYGTWTTTIHFRNGGIYAIGHYSGTPDLDPGCDTNYLPYALPNHNTIFIAKFELCSAMYFINDSVSICKGMTYYFPDGDSSTVETVDTSCMLTFDGCDSVIVTYLEIVNTIDVSVSDSSNFLKANLSNAEYQWLKCDSTNYTVLEDDTNQLFLPKSNGSYAVIVSDGLCKDTSNCKSATGVGINDIHASREIKVYPNPSKDIIEIVSSDEIQSVKLFDITGKLIHSKNNISQKHYSLNLNDYKSTVFILQVESASQFYHEKVVRIE